MRKWRVGSFSMGLLLIMLGVIMFWGNISDPGRVAQLVVKWWPLLLVILGAEMLVHIYFSKEDKPKVKYDFVSIIFIVILGAVSIGFYSLQAVGLLDQVQAAVSAGEYTVAKPEQKVTIGDEIKRIVIRSEGWGQLRIESTTEKDLSVLQTSVVVASKQEQAEQYTHDEGFATRSVGDTLYLDLKRMASRSFFHHDIRSDYTIVIPKNVEVEVETSQSIEVNIRDLQNNWTVNARSPIKAIIPKEGNFLVEAVASLDGNDGTLGGNIKWQMANPSEMSATPGQVKGHYRLGEGKYKLYLESDSMITVNER